MHDAWAPYDTYARRATSCAAHALRELQAVTDAAPAGEWCWASQAADALTAMQKLVSEAISQGRDAVDPDALAQQVSHYRSAALIGISQTRDRPGALARKHHALARRLLDRQDDYLRFTADFTVPPDNNGCERDLRMANSGRKSPAACALSPAPASSARSAATYPPPPSTALVSSTRSSCSQGDGPGCRRSLRLSVAMAREAIAAEAGEEPMGDRVPAEFASWPLAWADEFHGPAGSPADPRTWRPETGGGGWGNSELQYYTSETANAALDGMGSLAITVARPDPQLAAARYDGCRYTSARLITKNLRSFRYGLIQAKIKLPAGRGIWPAFWMLGTSIDTAGWPGCGEIDVMENFGTNPAAVHGTIHGPGYSGAGGITASHDAGSPLAAGFHVYSVCWEPGRIRWYAGQALYHTVTPADLQGHPWVFDHDFYLLINVAVGGRFSAAPDASTAFPKAMLIDYIRVYTTT